MNDPVDNANVCQLFHELARGNIRPAIIMPGSRRNSTITFEQLHEGSLLLGNSLREVGLDPGDRAIIMIPMSIDLYMTLLAVVSIGATAVFVDPWIPPRQMAAFARFAEPTTFIGIGKSHLLRRMEPELKKIKKTVTTGKTFFGWPAKYQLSILKLNMEPCPVTEVQPDQPSLITFTSGSSGEPKGANRTHRFLRAQHDALSREFPFRADDVDMPTFPVFALNNLVSGITSVVPDMDFKRVAEADGGKIAAQMIRHRVTTCTVSPPLLERMCDHFESGGQRPAALRRILTGGAPISDRQLRRWQSHFESTEIIVAYGSTEAEPVSHISASERLGLDDQLAGYCTGRPMPALRTRVIEIVKEPGRISSKSLQEWTLPDGEIGELLVSGEHVCRDYFRNPDATAENKLIDQTGAVWHRMGDTGYFDEAGRFWLTGRVHSTICRNGQLVHPQLVEQAVARALPDLRQVAAIGMPDRALDQAVWVVVVDGSGDAAGIEQRVMAALNQVTVPLPCDRVIVRDQLLPVDPRHNSKIDYVALARLLLDGSGP